MNHIAPGGGFAGLQSSVRSVPRFVSITLLIQHLLCAHWVCTQALRSGPPAERATGAERVEISTDDPWVLVVSGRLEPEATFKIARNCH